MSALGKAAWRRGLLAALAVLGLASATSAQAQTSPSRFTSGHRYDLMGRETGTISPDPDGISPFAYPAVRNTFDDAGRLIKVESGYLTTWQADSIAPANWTTFTVKRSVETTYDGLDRKLTETVKDMNGAAVSLTQYSYDAVGRLLCTAERMNPAAYGALPASACTMGTAGSQGEDRIAKNVYDDVGQLLQVRKAVGSTTPAVESAEATYTYTANGKLAQVIDGEGNRAEMRYDGFDRRVRWVFPSTTRPSAYNDATPATAAASAGALDETDYELYDYDPDNNRTTFRKRDGATFTLTYDPLHRQTVKQLTANPSGVAPTNRRDVYSAYDARGLLTRALFDSVSGEGLTNAYDGFGRLITATQALDSNTRTLAYCYDGDSNRTRVSFPDSTTNSGNCATAWTNYSAYAYDDLDRPTGITRNGSATIAAYGYDEEGKRLAFNGGFSTSYGYDPAGRLATLTNNLPAPGGNNQWTFGYNPASQIVSNTRSNDAFAWTGHTNFDRTYSTNGLNQYSQTSNTVGGAVTATFCYDANGNLTADGTNVYLYDAENRLVERRVQANTNCAALAYTGTLLATLRYDPAGRLYQVSPGSGATRFLNDGDALVAEYSDTGVLLRRYVHGADAKSDDPIAWYEGANFDAASERLLRSDWQGSIVAVSDSPATTLIAINRYDEYGIPQGTNQGRFQYTGQAWIGELGMYYYKARMYSPTLGRFMQTDPVGYKDQVNLYEYVGSDPVLNVDFTGTEAGICTGSLTCGGASGTTQFGFAMQGGAPREEPVIGPNEHSGSGNALLSGAPNSGGAEASIGKKIGKKVFAICESFILFCGTPNAQEHRLGPPETHQSSSPAKKPEIKIPSQKNAKLPGPRSSGPGAGGGLPKATAAGSLMDDLIFILNRFPLIMPTFENPNQSCNSVATGGELTSCVT